MTSFAIATTYSIFEMLFMSLINYCAAYFAFVQTKIRQINVLLQDGKLSSDGNEMLILIKDIIAEHSIAIE